MKTLGNEIEVPSQTVGQRKTRCSPPCVTIIGLIMGLIGPRVLNYLSESKVKAAKI